MKLIILIICELCLVPLLHGQKGSQKIIPEMLAMDRARMTFADDQLLLFNGYGSASPCQQTITGVTNLQFPPIVLPTYNFHFNIIDNVSGALIHDDSEYFENLFLEKGIGAAESNGANFRPGNPKMIVPQEDIWQPNQSYRRGVFYYTLADRLLSFKLESWTSVSGDEDEVLLKMKIQNRTSEQLDITLVPFQEINHTISTMKAIPEIRKGIFSLSSGSVNIDIASDVHRTDSAGYRIKLPAYDSRELYFAIQLTDTPSPTATRQDYQSDIKERFGKAYQRTCERLQKTAGQLPKIRSENEKINELYRRSLLTVNECKWERNNFITNPFWASGSWIISMIWDQCYASDVLAMVDPKGLRESIKLTLRESEMKRSYIFWDGARDGSKDDEHILYLNDPFALQTMIDSYLIYTGDKSILDEKSGDTTIYEWMKRWGHELHDKYGRSDGLIDVEDPEHLIEIRTYGNNHVVPVVNGLAIKFYRRLSQWAFERGDGDSLKFRHWSELTLKSFTKKLWNDGAGWFDNLYPDGSRGITMTFHLYELMAGSVLTPYQKSRMTEHIRKGEFLAPYGLYSMSKKDSLHYDMVDDDFGGGGQYMGLTFRIVKDLFANNQPEKALDILERVAKYTDQFPYITGNPKSDRPFQNRVSLCLHIGGGGALEAIISGIFGLRPKENGDIEIDPYYSARLGNSELLDFKFRDNSYDVILKPTLFSVKKNGRLIATNKYGDKLLIRKK